MNCSSVAEQHLVDVGDGLENIEQPIFDGRRHLKHLDQIVRDPFRDARFEQISNGYLRWNTDGIFN